MKKILLIMTALLLWNCTDYAGNWENDYGAFFGGGSGNGGNSASNKGKSLNFGRLIDPRDGKEYRTIQVGAQSWMAEDLKFDMPDVIYASNPNGYSLYYNWDAAMIACPSGWHLPSIDEFRTLKSGVGENKEIVKLWLDWGGFDWDEFWSNSRILGSDTIAPASKRMLGAPFWSSSVYDYSGSSYFFFVGCDWVDCKMVDIPADYMSFFEDYMDFYESTAGKHSLFPVRCLKD